MKKQTLLLVMGGGGHTAQMLELKKLLGQDYHYEHLIGKGDSLTEEKLGKPVWRVHRPREHGENPLISALRTTRSFIESLAVMAKIRPKAVISAGPGITFPLFLAAKLFFIKTIYIESWSRVYHKSKTGKLCYRLSDLFFVQWPEMEKNYPKAMYAGRLK